MGSSWTSISFKGVSQLQVINAIRDNLPLHRCFVSAEVNGWVTIVDRDSEQSPHESILVHTVNTICRACGCPAIVLGLMDSDILYYWLFDGQGGLLDYSEPTDFMECTSEKEMSGLAGNPEMIAALCKQGVTGLDVREVLTKEMRSRRENFEALADLLGIAKHNASLSYDFIMSNIESEEMWNDYVLVE
jgi:hypothetical protein